MKLQATISSYMNKDTVYGQAGEEVTVVSKYGNVLIVEGARGRFPVSVLLVSDANLEIKETPIVNKPLGRKQKSKALAVKTTATLF